MEDLTKILKIGDRVYSPIFGYGVVTSLVPFNENDNHPICVKVKSTDLYFTKYGKFFDNFEDGECLLFPSETERTWDGYKTASSQGLQSYDKVLVRDSVVQKWNRQIFLSYHEGVEYPYECVGEDYKYCIPYEGNQDLVNNR